MNHEKLGKILQVITKQGSHFLLGTDQHNNSFTFTLYVIYIIQVLGTAITKFPHAYILNSTLFTISIQVVTQWKFY